MALSKNSESIDQDVNIRNSYRWPAVIASLTMLLTMIPYFIGFSFAEPRKFMWLGYNLDDSCVYLSWLRQAADGSWKALNLFTTDTQHGMLINPLFLFLGKFAALTHIPLIGVYHGSRVVFGAALLLAVWALLLVTVKEERTRKLAFLFVCFSSGLGWLPLWWDTAPILAPIDTWQPEAITFLSLYLSPLFAFSMLLQVSILTLLLQAERSKSYRPAVAAGMCGSLLGLTHSYDVISLFVVWGAYVAVQIFITKNIRQSMPTILRAKVFGLITLPSVIYIYLQFQSDPVFRARANVPTLAPPVAWVFIGYGLTLILAAYGYVSVSKKHKTAVVSAFNGTDSFYLFSIWAIVNVLVSYLPHAAFQRKLLQGAHFPIAILAGVGFSLLLQKYKIFSESKNYWLAATAAAMLLSITNIRFALRDIQNYVINSSQTRQQRPFLQSGEIEAMEWIEHNTPADSAIQPLPFLTKAELSPGQYKSFVSDSSLACFTPGLIHRAVYCGHWGETPDFGGKLMAISRIGSARMNDTDRQELLKKMRVKYLVFSQKSTSDDSADDLMPLFRGRLPLPAYLKLIHSNNDADVYEISLKMLIR